MYGKVLVTGGAGYIGSHTAQQLLDAGNDVVILDNLSNGHRAMAPEGARFVRGDLADRALLAEILGSGIDAVLHFAGSIVVPESVADPLGYYRNNTLNTHGLLQACVEQGVGQFIFSSTAAVYGDTALVPVPENAPTLPISPYGASKLMTEWMLRDTAAAHGLRYVALRYFNVAGADLRARRGQSSKNATHLIKVAVEVLTGQREKLAIFGGDYPTDDGTGVRDYIHVVDLALGHVRAMERLDTMACEAINLGTGRGTSVLELVNAFERVNGVRVPFVMKDRRAGDVASCFADPSRALQRLGWKTERSVDDMCRDAWRWQQFAVAQGL